jgi:hypothetical protein
VANTFITPTVIAARGIATLYNSIVLAGLVWRDFDSDFTGKQGDTVTVRRPATLTSSLFNQTTRTTTYQDSTEDSDDITLDKLRHVPFYVTDEQMTLEISDFQAQLLTPAMEAIAQDIDADLAEALIDAAEGVGGGGTVAMSDDPASTDTAHYVFRKSREKLTRNKLPMGDRHAVLSPEATTVALGESVFLEADKSGTTDALRNAIVGRAFGFETYETQVFGLGAGDKGVADGVAFHRTALILATRPLQKPRGVPAENVATSSYKSLGLRVIYSYDHDAKKDKVTVDTLYGLLASRPEAAVQLSFGQGS